MLRTIRRPPIGFAALPAMIAGLVLVLAACPPALAQSIAQIATDWGLLGSFSMNCSEPRSRQNVWILYVVRDGRLYYEQEYGDSGASNEVASARVRPDGNIEIVLNFTSVSPPQTRVNVNTKGPNGSLRTLISKNANTDEYSIRDGVLTASGRPSNWVNRCR